MLASACHHGIGPHVAGSGKRVIEKRELPAFNSITTEGAFDIEIVCQKDQAVQLEGDDNILPLVETEVSNNVLHIRPRRPYQVNESIVVKITVPTLNAISATGAGKINVVGLKSEELVLNVSGAPSVMVAGETKALNIDASGAARIDTHKLKAEHVIVDSKGVSKIELYASKRLVVTISGPSQVAYEGDPELSQTIHGPGSLVKREHAGA
jgi:hypothetical protein